MTLLSTVAPMSTIVQAESPSPTQPVTVQDPLVQNPLQTNELTEKKDAPMIADTSEPLIEDNLAPPATPFVDTNKQISENKLDSIVPTVSTGNSNLLKPTSKLENYAINQYYDSATIERIGEDGKLTKLNHGDTIDYYDQFNFKYNWSVDNSASLVAGDVIRTIIPAGINPLRTGPVNVTNKNGIVVGSWSIVTSQSQFGHKVLEFTVNEDFVGINDRSGTIDFTAQLDFSIVENYDHWMVLNFDTKASESIQLYVKKGFPIDPNERLYKFGQVDTTNPEVVIWSIRVNYSGKASSNVQIYDTPQDQTYIPDRIWASWGEFDKTGAFVEATSEPVPNSSIAKYPGGGFRVNFGDIGEGTNRPSGVINVAMKAKDGGAAGRYFNSVEYQEDGKSIQDLIAATPKSGGGGEGEGKTTLSVHLVDSTDSSINLERGNFAIFKDDEERPIGTSYKVVGGYFTIPAELGSKYRVVQTEAGEADVVVYGLGDITEHTVTVNGNTELTYYNVPLKGHARLTKVDADDPSIRIPGAKFTLFKSFTNKILAENLITDENGQIVVSNLDTGNVYFRETEAAPGYALDTSPIGISITEQMINRPGSRPIFVPHNDKIFTNKKAAQEISLIKKDKSTPSILLPDAHFDLYKVGETTPIKTDLVTDANGLINVSLEYGDYYFQETIPPTGYVLDETKQHFTVSSTEQTPLVVFNEKQRVTMIDSQFPSDLNFGTHSIQNSSDEKWLATVDGNQTSKTITSTLKVDDNRTTTSGWKLKAKQLEQFKNGATELTGAHLLITAGTVNSNANVIPSNGIQGTTATLIPNEEKTIFGAKANEGTGISTLELSKFELSVPKTAAKKVVKYSSSIVWTLSDTP